MAEERAPRKGFIRRWTVRLIKLGLVMVAVAAPAVYFGLPAIARTPWALKKVEARIERMAGADVNVGSMDFSWKRGLTLRNVSFPRAIYGSTEVSGRFRALGVKPDYLKLLACRLRADAVLDTPSLIIRAHSGSAESSPRLPRIGKCGFQIVSFHVKNGTIVREEENSVHLTNLDLDAAVTARRGRVEVDIRAMTATVNGRAVTGTARLATGSSPMEVTAEGVKPDDELLKALRDALSPLRGRVELRFQTRPEPTRFF